MCASKASSHPRSYMEIDTVPCADCGDTPRVWGYNHCQCCLDEMDRRQQEALQADVLETSDASSRYDNTTLEGIAEISERAFWDGHISPNQRRIMRWAVKKCYEVG